jgi:universal stress protein A
MSIYQKILLVVDLTDDSETIGARAKAVAAAFGSTIEILHVVEYVPVEPMGEALLPAVQVEDELIERAKQRLTELAAKLELSASPQMIETGNIKGEIVRVAKERKADLIVMGARERHGLAILLNFTEDTILHEAGCDVLAVRLKK